MHFSEKSSQQQPLVVNKQVSFDALDAMRQQQQLHNPDAQNHSFSTGTQHNQLTDGRTLARYGSLTSSDALFDALFLDSTVNNRRPTGSDTRVVGSGEIDGRAR